MREMLDEKKIKEIQEKMIKQDVSAFIETKGKFDYLSWSNAWRLFIEHCPTAKFEVIMSDNMSPIFGSKTAGWMVYTKVEIEGLTRMMWLPCKDHSNKVILSPTMMDVNTTIMRCLVKNLALFGLGITVFGAEDIPGNEGGELKNEQDKVLEATSAYITNEQWETIEELGIECGGHKKTILEELEAPSWNKVELAKGLSYIKQCKEHLKK